MNVSHVLSFQYNQLSRYFTKSAGGTNRRVMGSSKLFGFNLWRSWQNIMLRASAFYQLRKKAGSLNISVVCMRLKTNRRHCMLSLLQTVAPLTTRSEHTLSSSHVCEWGPGNGCHAIWPLALTERVEEYFSMNLSQPPSWYHERARKHLGPRCFLFWLFYNQVSLWPLNVIFQSALSALADQTPPQIYLKWKTNSRIHTQTLQRKHPPQFTDLLPASASTPPTVLVCSSLCSFSVYWGIVTDIVEV